MQERLWPKEEDMPMLIHEDEGGRWEFRWDNTWIRTYRTGSPRYDEELKKYDHILYLASTDDETSSFQIMPLESSDPVFLDVLRFLIDNGYRHRVDPIPDAYILEHMAMVESRELPEALGPEFKG